MASPPNPFRSALVCQDERAAVLCDNSLSSDDKNLTKLLDFFGVSWSAVTLDGVKDYAVRANRICLLSSAAVMAEVFERSQVAPDSLPACVSQAASVYIYGFQHTGACLRLLRKLTGDPHARLETLETPSRLSITAGLPEMCGPLSGLAIPVEQAHGEAVFRVAADANGLRSIITAKQGEQFFAINFAGVPFFLSASSSVINLDDPSPAYFDVKRYACSAVSAAMYVKWAFRESCWTSRDTSACLIVDDPPLTPRYGHLDFRDALSLMGKHDFVTTIAFIPWNWWRAHRGTVELFRQHADRLSLCVHGCDHTGAEFASRSAALLDRKCRIAGQRMSSLSEKNALPYDRVMVFPQGAFSPEVGRALKLNGFAAAVNTEVAPAGPASNKTTIADLWSVANLKYGGFPIFSRRYPEHGVENFAFDSLLGKPCLIVGHHEIFRDQGRELVKFIAMLNSLKWNIRWRTLGVALRHSYLVRGGQTSHIKMFGEVATIENCSLQPGDISVVKDEMEPQCVQGVAASNTEVPFQYESGLLRFNVIILPKTKATVRIAYRGELAMGSSGDGLAYRIKVGARRYLSEFRDNHVSRSDLLGGFVAALRRVLK